MLRIAIADDEERIRLGLAKMITQFGSEYSVAGCYANGLELLKGLEEAEADVVITDIKMPAMDGMRLIKELQEQGQDIRCIIISGFSDFEYARQALRYGVVDYLSKPIDKKDLFRVLEQLLKERRKKRAEADSARNEKIKAYVLDPRRDPDTLGELERQLPEIQRLLFACVAVRFDRTVTAEEWRSLQSARFNVPFVEALAVADNELAVLFGVAPGKEPNIQLLGRALAEHAMGLVKGQHLAGIGSPAKTIGDWPLTYREAVRACDYAIYSSQPNPIVRAEEVCHFSLAELFGRMEKELKQELQVLDAAKAVRCLRGFFQDMEQLKPDKEQLIECCEKMIYVIHHEIGEFSTALERRCGAGFSWSGLVRGGMRFKQIESDFLAAVQQLLEDIQEERERSGNRVVEKVKKMIEEEYHQEIELSKLADRVFLTPSYLSKLFKTETGATLTDYVIGVRMNNAKHLLRAHAEMKTYEVGELVGYPDPAYFNKIFKKMVGVTPKEYKDFVR